MEKLLLHHCCAPCSPKIVEMLKQSFDIESFWYNPNIHPGDEYENREGSLIRFTEMSGLRLHFGPEIACETWIQGYSKSNDDRCRYCYVLRLNETANMAIKLGIMNFSTTLLSSPWQKHDIIKSLGLEIAQREGLCFVCPDLRPFYYEGKNEARRLGLYVQKYCGCVFSLQDKIERDRKKYERGNT